MKSISIDVRKIIPFALVGLLFVVLSMLTITGAFVEVSKEVDTPVELELVSAQYNDGIIISNGIVHLKDGMKYKEVVALIEEEGVLSIRRASSTYNKLSIMYEWVWDNETKRCKLTAWFDDDELNNWDYTEFMLTR